MQNILPRNLLAVITTLAAALLTTAKVNADHQSGNPSPESKEITGIVAGCFFGALSLLIIASCICAKCRENKNGVNARLLQNNTPANGGADPAAAPADPYMAV